MKQAQGKNKIKIFLGINILLFFVLVVAFGREYVSHLQIQREIKSMESEYEELQQTKLQTLNLIEELASPYYLEAQGRTKHGLAKEGETLIIIEGENELFSGDVQVEEEIKIANPKVWFYYFFNHERFEELKNYEDK
ncbi:septum formation initiator family protein [Patescibacteria group bacterium]|nr:septum formation initiator family protein [Patescibacteria group bacterium]